MDENTEEPGDELRANRLRKLAEMRAQGQDPFAIERYERTHLAETVTTADAPHWQLEEDAQHALTFAVAGRLTAHRPGGKAIFADVRDESGRVQVYVRINDVGEQAFQQFKQLDLGDVVGIRGFPFRTRTGEPSLHVKEFTLLAKSLRTPPFGKQDDQGRTYNTLADKEERYRHRYLDLLSNPDSRAILTKRSKVVSSMRRFLEARGFLEVETPVLQLVAGGAAAKPFLTHHNALDHEFKLRISLELYLKRLIIGGYEKVFEIGRVFRNEGMSTRHNPEFTLMELYQAYANLEDVMELVEAMYESICREINGMPTFLYRSPNQNNQKEDQTESQKEDQKENQNAGEAGEAESQLIDLSARPYRRLPMLEGIAQYAGIEAGELTDLETAKAACRRIKASFDINKEDTLGGLIEKLHEVYTQPNLIQPTFITDFPTETSPLAKKRADNPNLTRRFEIYMATQELGNAFSEINDPLDQRERFEGQVAQRQGGNDEAHPMDEEFLRAMEYGMPPTGGLGIGIDRLALVLTGAESVRDVILFPLMRPETDTPQA